MNTNLKECKKIYAQYFDGGKKDNQRLKKLWNIKRKELEIRQSDVADVLHIKTESSISHYLTGRIPLNLETIIGFSLIMGVTVAEISPTSAKLLEKVVI